MKHVLLVLLALLLVRLTVAAPEATTPNARWEWRGNSNWIEATMHTPLVSKNLESAVVEITCYKEDDETKISVLIGYWLRGQVRQGQRYSFDLFNSAISGRPASYDFGSGPVSTAHIREPRIHSDEPMPNEYHVAVREFYDEIASGRSDSFSVDFSLSGRGGEDFRLLAPNDGIREAFSEMTRLCPAAS